MRLIQSLTLIVTLGLFLTNCNEEPTSKNEDKLVGDWLLESQSRVNCTNPNDNGEETFDCIQQDCSALILSQDLTFIQITIENGVSTRITGNWSLNGNTIRLSFVDEDNTIVIEQQWELPSSNQLKIFENNEFNGCEISSNYTRA